MSTALFNSGRLVAAIAAAVVATFAIFLIMQKLIASGATELSPEGERHVIDFVRVKEQEKIKQKDRKPEPPPKPEKEPPKPEMPQNTDMDLSPNTQGMSVAKVAFQSDIDISAGISSGAGSGEYLPIVKVDPVYPRRALRRGIEGYAVVEYTVTESGSVKDPKIVEADPPGIFDRVAIDAAKKYKYRPKMMNNKPMAVSGVRTIIWFKLDKNRRRR